MTDHAGGLRLRPKIPIVDHVAKGYPMMVRDGIYDRVKALPYFATVARFSKNKMFQVMPEHVPYVGVYLQGETYLPDGDANIGEPRFRTMVRIGFSVIVQNNNADLAEQKLDFAQQALMTGLLCDPTLRNNHDFKIQAFVGGESSHHFGAAGLNNELPTAELQFSLRCDLGVILYEPVIPDMLEGIHVDVAYPDINDPGDWKIKYDVEQ